MPTILGRDVKATFAERLKGRLYPATLTRMIPGTYDPDDPAHGPATTPVAYSCDAIAFGYTEEFIQGEQVKNTDFQVTIILGSITLAADDAVAADLDLATVTGASIDTIVEAVDTGAAGDMLTIELVGDGVEAGGSIDQVGTHLQIHLLPGSSTIADLEMLVATSSIIQVKSPSSSQTKVILSGDAFASVALAGGSDATVTTVDYVPQPGDTILVPPPGSDTPAEVVVSGISKLTNAAVTCHVGGLLNDG